MNERDEIRRLLRYIRPYTPRLVLGILLIAVMGVAEFLVAFAFRPAFDVILNPHSTAQALVLFQIPYTHHVIDLHSFVPRHFHNVWTVFALALLFIALVKGAAEYSGSILIQYVGLSAVTDLRNQVYSQVVQQPVGFFQHNAVGRVMSAVISDIEQVRNAFSDWFAEFFRQIFALVAFVTVLLVINWRMAVGSAVLIPLVVWPVSKFGRQIRHSSEKSRSRLADLSQILQETVSGKSRRQGLRNGGIRNPQVPRGCGEPAPRKHALDQSLRRHVAADGYSRRRGDRARLAFCARAKSKPAG